MPTLIAWLKDIEVSYPLIHMGDVNTIDINVQFISCGTGKEQIDETYKFIDILINAIDSDTGKIKISVEESNDGSEEIPKIIRSRVSNMQ